MRRGVQLYIAGREVDLGDDSWILYNWTREDLSNPTAVINSSSHQISIPGTRRNNAVFGAVFRLDRKTMFGTRYDGTYFDPTRKTPFSLYDAAGQILESGYCRLDSVNSRDRRHAYTVSLYGGLGSFFYNLSAKADGSARTLLDLIWTGDNGEDVPSFNVASDGAAAVADAWSYLNRGGAELGYYHFWNIINFAPCYNGLPEDFDAKHALSSYAAYANVMYQHAEADDPQTVYEYKSGLDCALLTFQNAHTEWEVGDLRWYLQRPVVSVKAFFTAICDTRNNGGYTVTLDDTFFRSSNPAWADAWWTLPLIKTEDRGGGFSLGSLLASTKSPMKYLVDYCKIYGLMFLYDAATKHVSIVTRATFYGEGRPVLDLSQRVDLSQDADQNPILADSRWYQMGDGGKGEFVEQYKRAYGKGYAVQRIDTGYEFDAGTKVLTEEQTFQDAAEVQESNRLFASVYNGNVGAGSRLLYIPAFEQVTEELWNGDESVSFDLTLSRVPSTQANPVVVNDVPGTPGADWLPKLQIHGADNKAVDSADILLYFTGMKDAPLITESVRKRYYLTNDSAAMQELAGAPCWDLTRTGIPLWGLPSFRRVVISGQYITESFEWGRPEVRPVLDAVYPTGEDNSIYGRWWKAYLSDRYNADTRVLKCMADLRGLPVGQALLRRFFWLDGALWTLNAIRNHSFTSWDLTEVELVKVQDKSAYDTGPGSISTHYLTLSPSASSYNVSGNGDTLNITVRSSSAWTLAMSGSPSWLTWSTASGGEGTSVITATVQANTDSSRRTATVTLTNQDGITVTFSVVQPPQSAASISVSPSSITIPAAGTGTGSASRGRSFAVTATGDWSLDLSTVPSWLTVSTSLTAVSMRCGENTSTSPREAALKVYLNADSTKYAIVNVTQEAGSSSGSISIVDGQGNEGRTSPAAGETFTLAITASGAWTLTNNTGFATLSASSGTGNGTVTVTVPAYTGSSDRSGTIVATLDGTSVTDTYYLQQEAPTAPDTYIELAAVGNVAHDYVEVPSGSGGDGMRISSNAAWTLATPDSWIHPSYTSSYPWNGSGNAQAWFTFDANTGAARTGCIIATLTSDSTKTATFYVRQAAGSTPTTPTLNAYFSKASITDSAQTVDLIIDTQSDVAWSIDNVSSGMTPDSYSGTGPATVPVSVSATSVDRTLSLRVRNTTYNLNVTATISQYVQATRKYLRVSPFGTINVAADVTSLTFALESNTSWRASTSASGVTVYPSSGNNNSSITVTFGANSSTTQSRTIPVTFVTTSSDVPITVNASIVQAPAGSEPSTEEISVTPTTLTMSAGRTETKTVTVTATAAWTASKSASWITLSADGGNAGEGMSLSITTSPNNGVPRTGTVTLICGSASATVTVIQGRNGSLDVTSDDVEIPAAGGSADVTVYASSQWDIADPSAIPGWLEVSMPSHGGSNNGEILTFTASENTNVAARSATIRIQLTVDTDVYRDITVTQDGQVKLYLSPLRVNIAEWQADGIITVTCNTNWHVSEISSGLIIESSDQSGSGNGQIPWYIDGNPISEPRTLRVTVETNDGRRSATVSIYQEPGSFYFNPSDPIVLGSNGEMASVDLVSSAAWSVDSNTIPVWLAVSPMGGTTSHTTVTFSAMENTSTSDRTATLAFENIAGERITMSVTQHARSEHQLTISPTDVHLASPDATSGSLAITSDTSWVVEVESGLTPPLTVSQSSGTGSRTITWNLPANSWELYFKHVIRVRTTDGSIVRTCEIWQPPRSGVIISFSPDIDHLTFYDDAPASTKTFQLRVVALEDWFAWADGDASWLEYDQSFGTANTPVTVTFTATTSSSNVLTAEWVVETSGGYTRTITITSLPSR